MRILQYRRFATSKFSELPMRRLNSGVAPSTRTILRRRGIFLIQSYGFTFDSDPRLQSAKRHVGSRDHGPTRRRPDSRHPVRSAKQISKSGNPIWMTTFWRSSIVSQLNAFEMTSSWQKSIENRPSPSLRWSLWILVHRPCRVGFATVTPSE